MKEQLQQFDTPAKVSTPQEQGRAEQFAPSFAVENPVENIISNMLMALECAQSSKPRVPEVHEVFPLQIALEYAEACGVDSNADDPIELAEIIALLEHIGQQLQNKEILECGTGPGFLAKLMAEQGGYVTAVDASETMVSWATARHAATIASGNLAFMVGEVRRLIFGSNTFDLVVAKHLLHQLPSKAAAQFLLEAVRVIKHGGVVIIGDYNRGSSREDRDARLQFTLPEMQPLLEESFDASFTPEELISMLAQIPNIEFAVVLAEDPARLSTDLQQKIQEDPVKGHATDWRTRLRVVIRKI